MSRRAKVRLLSLRHCAGAVGILRPARESDLVYLSARDRPRAFIDLVVSGELQSYMKDSLLVLLYASILR